MTSNAIADAECTMARHVNERRNANASAIECTDTVLLAFKLSVLHLRMRAAEEYRLAPKTPRG